MNSVFIMCKRLANNFIAGRGDDPSRKIDVFYAVGRLSDDEYTDLYKLLEVVDDTEEA